MAVAERALGSLLTPAKLRVWGWLSVLSLVDQGLTAGAGFGVNLLLARWMPLPVYGAFAVAFAGFLLVSGFHNVLLLEPISVMGPSRHAGNLPAYFRAQIVIHMLLVGVLSAALLLGGAVLWRVAPDNPLAGAVVGGGLALPFLLLAWLARRMCYVVQRPALAMEGSAVYLGFVLAGLFALAHFALLNSFTAFVLMGCGSLVSAGLLLWRLGSFGEVEIRLRWLPTLQENWTYGKWLVGTAVLNPAVGQGQVLIIAGFLGLGAAGALRAMQLPSLVMTQVVAATGLLFLPVLSADHGRGLIERMRHKAMLLSLALAGVAVCFAGSLAVFREQFEKILLGGKYAAYAWLMAILALVPVVNAFSTGYSIALRASRRPQFDLLANIVAAPVALLSAVFFIRWWGLAGAAASMVLGFLTLCVVTFACFCMREWGQA